MKEVANLKSSLETKDTEISDLEKIIRGVEDDFNARLKELKFLIMERDKCIDERNHMINLQLEEKFTNQKATKK